MVAGSNTVHSFTVPATRPSLASRRPTLSINAGGSFSVRLSRRAPAAPPMSSDSVRPSRRPLIDIEPVPGSSEKSNDSSANVRSTRAVVLSIATVLAPSNEHCRRVFLQFKAGVSRPDLTDGKSDLFAAVIDATPLGGGSVTGEIGREVSRRRLQVRAVDHDAHRGDPRGEREDRERTRDAPRKRADDPGDHVTETINVAT